MAQNNQNQFFRIRGELVELVTERVERAVALPDLMGEVAKSYGITTPILPLGCRFYSQKGENSVFIIEQEPHVRTVRWCVGDDKEMWKLAFPYIIFIITVTGSAVTGNLIFYRNSPLKSLEDVVLSTNLNNCNLGGGICTGDFRVEGETPAQKAESFVVGFWKSRFNRDIPESWNAHQNIEHVSSLKRWEEETRKNPLFPLAIKWREYKKLAEVIGGGC